MYSSQATVFESEVIDKLIPLRSSRSMDLALSALEKDNVVSNTFLVKMEVNRLRSPSTRSIDLRDRKNATCLSFTYAGISHYLTKPAINEFQRLVKFYNDLYTTGVYESLLKSLDNLIESTSTQEHAAKASKYDFEVFNVERLGFGLYQTRAETRVFYSSKIMVSTPNQDFSTRTTDMSTSGVRILLPENTNVTRGDVIDIKYEGIRKEFINEILNDFISYKVVGIDGDESKRWARAIRLDSSAPLNLFLKRFIQERRVFDRVNSSDLCPTLLNKGYENIYVQKSSGLPMFFGKDLSMAHVLVSDNNKSTLDFWVNHRGQNTLSLAINKTRLSYLLGSEDSTDIQVYAFSYELKGKTLFFTACDDEFPSSKIKNVFLSLGLKLRTLRIFKLSLNHAKCPYNKLGLENDGLSKITIERISKISAVGVLHDITTDAALSDIKYSLEGANVLESMSLLKPFVVFGESTLVDIVPASFMSKRKSLRYLYNLQVRACRNNKVYNGTSKNFSVEGLLIELNSPIDAATGDLLNIEIPQQKNSAALQSHPYRIIKMNRARTDIHLKLTTTEHLESNKRFFGDLIKANKGQIKSDHGPCHSKGLLDGLCRLYSRLGNINVLFMQTKRHSLVPRRLMTNDSGSLANLLKSCSTDKSTFNLFPILNSKIGSLLNSPDFLERSPSDGYLKEDLFIYIDSTKEYPRVISKLASELPTPKMRSMFLKNSRSKGHVYVLQLHMMKTSNLDLTFVDEQLASTHRYARYHIDDVKNELQNISTAINLIDITKLTLKRIGIVK